MPSFVEIVHVVLEKKILNLVNIFSLFRNYLPLKKGEFLYLNKLESSSPKDEFVEIGLVVLERKISLIS